jgi:hypothetical protein
LAFNVGAAVGYLKLDMSGWTANVKRGMADTTGLKSKLGELGNAARQMAIPFAAVGTAITLSMRKMRNEAMKVEEAENLFVVSMGNMAEATRKWSEELSTAIGMNANSIREQVSTLKLMLGSMGLTEEGATELSKQLTKLTYDMASFRNISIDEAFNKITAGMTGEAEGLKRLGVVLLESTVQQWAWRNGLVETGKELTEQQKIIARFGALMEQTSKDQGDMARTADSATNQQKRFQETFLALRQELGKASAAASGPWYGAASRAMQAATAWAKGNEELAGTLTKVGQAAGYAMLGFAAITFAGPGLVSVFHGIAAAAGVAWAAIMGPVGLVVAAIASIGVAAYVLRAEFKQHLYGMQVDFQGLVNFINKGLDLMGLNFHGFFGFIGKGFIDLFNGIIGGWAGVNATIISLLKNPTDLNAALDAGVAAVQKDYFGGVLDFVVDDFKATGMDLKAIGAATAAQMAADIEAIQAKFKVPTVTEPGNTGVTEYKPLTQEELSGYIAAGSGGADKGVAAAAKKAEAAMKALQESGKAAYLALEPVSGSVAKIVEQMVGLKAAGLLTDKTRSLLGVELWKSIKDLAPITIDSIVKQVAKLDPVMKNAIETARNMESVLDANKILESAQPATAAFAEISAQLEKVKAGGRLEDESVNILAAKYWQDFGNMAGSELDILLEKISAMGNVGMQMANQMRELQMTAGSLEGVGEQADKEKEAWSNLASELSTIGGVISNIGSQLGNTTLSAIGQIITAVITMITTYAMMQVAAVAAAGTAAAAWLAILGPIYLVVAAISLVISLFGMFGKKAKTEISLVDKLMKGLEETMNSAIDKFTDQWVEFLKTGEFSFKEFVDSILEDLARMTTKLAMQEIVSGLFGVSFSAKGNVFDKGNIIPFARGGLVTSPSLFPMPKGRVGMMGEQGPEAIFPLSRDESGNLGIEAKSPGVVVNIIDQRQRGEQVQVRETTGRDGKRQLQITIRDAIEDLAAEGGLKRSLRLAGVAI